MKCREKVEDFQIKKAQMLKINGKPLHEGIPRIVETRNAKFIEKNDVSRSNEQ